jgi:diguanylate cyclase (GGDEF)-like protein/PAS domain S-box-containing protein
MNITMKVSPGVRKVFTPYHLKYFFIALIFVGLATSLRIWPLEALGSEFTWLVYYPIVISIAFRGGLYAGLLATAFACVTVIFFWSLFVPHPFIENGIDLLEMGVFVGTCSIASFYGEVIRRIQKALGRAEAAAKASAEGEQFIRTIINSTPNMMGYWDKDLRCRYANSAFSEWFITPPEDVIGLRFLDLVGEDLFALNEPYIRGALAGQQQHFDRTLKKADGSVGHIIGHYIPDFDADGAVRGFAIQASEVTFLKEIEEKLKLAACVFENTLDGVLITDVDGVILSVNPGFVEITGYSAKEAVGQSPRLLHSNRHDEAFYAAMWEEIKAKGRWNGEIWNRRKDGDLYLQSMTISMVRDEDGEPVRYVSVFSDITALWRKDEHIKHLAFHDALTDLPNRTLLMDRINQKVLYSNREQGSSLALMFLDLDGFKVVNDQFGHNVGDDLLKGVASRLLSLVRKSDTVARVGGDEFIFILNDPQGKDDITDVANRIVRSINEPITILGEEFRIGVSIGIATFPDDGQTPDDLIRNADTAMYAAKSLGRNNIRFFQS